jgi:hypothetical protein
MKVGIEGVKNSHLQAINLELLSKELRIPELGRTCLKQHKDQCLRPRCFCKDSEHQARPDLLLRQQFQRVAFHFSEKTSLLLSEAYVTHLLEGAQAANAIDYLAHWRPCSFFEAVAKLRCEAQLDTFLASADSCNDYEREYSYAFQHDNDCMRLASKIDEILKLKIDFWMETSKEEPRLSQLQNVGIQIVGCSHNLNRFYADAFEIQ